MKRRCVGYALTLFCFIPAAYVPAAEKEPAPNVVMIIIDDLNDWAGALNAHPQACTPNIDRLAERGASFTRAYATSPLCGPSRAAFLSGMRASTTGFYDNKGVFTENKVCMSRPSLPDFFRSNGYRSMGIGKVFHHNHTQFWDAFVPNGTRMYQRDDPRVSRLKDVPGIFDYGPLDRPASEFDDYKKADVAVRWLKETESRSEPFFLAVGFYLPHLPWYAPRTYHDMIPAVEDIYLDPVLENDLDDVPARGIRASNPAYYEKVQANGKIVRPEAVRAYLASIAFIDAQVGRVLDALENHPEKDRTIVVLFGDHGNHFGTKRHWHKNTLWEESLRTPLIISAPGLSPPGARIKSPASLLDIYPTLAELCGLEAPPHLEGRSLKPMLDQPLADHDTATVSHLLNGETALNCGEWKYIRYQPEQEELYHLISDPHEWDNLIDAPDSALVLKTLRARLEKELER